MNPVTVTAKNYGPYRDFTWSPADGLSAIIGVNRIGDGVSSNGSGKTKLLEAIPLALFGPSMPWSEYLTAGSDEDTCVVELEFEHGGDSYRVRRTYSAKGSGKTTLDFEKLGPDWYVEQGKDGEPEQVQCDPEWAPLTLDRQTDTQKLIDQTIGLTEATFAHSVFAAQGARHFADPSLPPRERKAIMADALGLGTWDTLLALVRTDISDLTNEIAAINARIGTDEADLAQKDEVAANHVVLTAAADAAVTALADLEKVELQVRERRDAAKTAAERIGTLVLRRDAAQESLKALQAQAIAADDARAAAEEIQASIAADEPIAAEREKLELSVDGLRKIEEIRTARMGEQSQLEQQAVQLDKQAVAKRGEARTNSDLAANADAAAEKIESGEVDHCGHCGQTLQDAAKEKAKATTIAEAVALTERANALLGEADDLDGQAGQLRLKAAEIEVPRPVEPGLIENASAAAAQARAASDRLLVLRERLAAAERATALDTEEFRVNLSRAEGNLNQAELALEAEQAIPERGTPEHLDQLEVALLDASKNLGHGRAADRDTQGRLAASGERLNHLASLASRAAEALAARAGLAGRLDHLKALERSYGRDGIPALILESSAIPHVENEAQRVLEQLGMPFRIELVTQRENKGGGLKDTLDVVVHDPAGPRRYETYSGGERTRLELALRIALARLIVQQRGSEVGLLALDEPSWLDAAGHTQLATVLRGLTEFRAIVLVSHDETLVDSFDQRVTVVRDESGSRLEEAA